MIKRILGGLARIEDGLLVALILGLILLAGAQILLRQFNLGLPWADPLLRAGVLWLALQGAAVATREQRQITVDAIARKLEGRLAAAVALLSHAFTAAVTLLLAWHGLRLVRDEMQFGGPWIADLPSWLPMLPIPVLLGLIGLRYLLFGCGQALELVRPQS